VRLEILRLLLNTDEDLSIRDIGKELGLEPPHVFYHLKKLAEKGIVTREEVGDRVYYTPQRIFTEGIEETSKLLEKISSRIDNPTSDKVADCLCLFMGCYNCF